MDQIDIFNKVKHIIARELNKDKQLINMDVSLKGDLNFDSIDHPLLMAALEKRFAVQISDEESDKLTIVAEIVELIEKKKGC
ncbi:MAG: acyl carrier protein [Candidatus Margulisiibacteriota bacterium]|nr:acyl carrier protein [Candidatus Margulisiibacteriota bacterium]